MKSVSDMISILSNAVYQQSRDDKSIGHELRDINMRTFNYLKKELQTTESKEFLGLYAHKLKTFRKWNPYSGKGIIEEGETPKKKEVVNNVVNAPSVVNNNSNTQNIVRPQIRNQEP
jgi:hypothetical protein